MRVTDTMNAMNLPLHLSESEREIRISEDFRGAPAGIAMRIGSTALVFRPRRSGSHRGEKMVYDQFRDDDLAKARLIVRAVNCHDDLLAACKGLMAAIDECRGPQGSLAWMRPIAAAQAAIANAEGGAP